MNYSTTGLASSCSTVYNQCLQSNSGLFRPEECCMFFSTFHNDDIELSLILNNSIDKRSRNM